MGRSKENHNAMADLRVGATAEIRDWRGECMTGDVFLSPGGAWLIRLRSGMSVPITPRELVSVTNGAAQMYNSLIPGARVAIVDWEGKTQEGIAARTNSGLWIMSHRDGSKWLIESYRLLRVDAQEEAA